MPPPVRAAAPFGLAYRAEQEADLPFIAALYASTRAEELAATGWPAEVRAAFLDQQHRAQHSYYRQAYPGAEWLIVEQAGVPVGRVYLDSGADELHLIDISFVAEKRGAGLGGALLADLIAHADALGLPLMLQVEARNRARRLYARLGFMERGENGLYVRMERPCRAPERG